MTDAEQDAVLAAMVRERRKLRADIACLEGYTQRARDGMKAAIEALNLASQGDWRKIEAELAFPPAEQLRERAIELRDARARLAELNDTLDRC